MYVHSERGLQTNLQVGDTTLTGLMYHPTNMTILPSVGGWKTIFSNLKIQLLSGFKLGCRGYNHRLKDIFKVETCWNSGFSHQLKGEKIEQLKLTVHLILGSQETMGFHALNEEPGLPGVTFPSNQFLEILDCLGYTWDIYIYIIYTHTYTKWYTILIWVCIRGYLNMFFSDRKILTSSSLAGMTTCSWMILPWRKAL